MEKVKLPQVGDLRVWWIPQVPMKPFYVNVKTLEEAALILDTLADYDVFQLENNIKPDYSNVGGLARYEEDAGGGEFPIGVTGMMRKHDWTTSSSI